MLGVLRQLLASQTLSFMDLSATLKDSFDSLPVLSTNSACLYIHGLLPLLSLKPDLKDAMVLVLRKSLFSRQSNSRLIAVRGFLLLVESSSNAGQQSGEGGFSFSQALSQRSSSSSSSSSSSHQSSNQLLSYNGVDSKLFLETAGLLRRAMSQEVGTRAQLYHRLVGLFERHPALRPYILDILLPQFLRYFQAKGSVPLKFELCISTASNTNLSEISITEPLPVLLSAVQRCLFTIHSASPAGEEGNEAEEDEERLGPQSQAKAAFKSG